MDTAALIWIIVGVLVVAIIVVVALALTARGRAEQKRRAEHDKAQKLRAEARETELAARESEARAAQTRADAASAAAAAQQAQAQAAQADVDARRLADSVGEHESEAMERRAEQQETLRKADEVDPYVTPAAADDHAVAHDDRVAHADAAQHADAAHRDERAAGRDGVPAAPDGVLGRDAADARHDTAHHEEPAITRPPAWATDASVDSSVDDGAVPPATRRDPA
ncbi:hypothetical protein [Microbacterium sulfonylureivorans]|uniref:hypothetical protein n=1 Tax=Microbacterium sulfonylureivorans TaxID=2486854 RepID=UPI000FDB98B3|nr:hypothetical protein [Microbacterium sulfonylureivorans]